MMILDKLLTLTLPPSAANGKFYQPILVAGIIVLGLAIVWLPVKVTGLLLGGVVFLALLLRHPLLSLYVLIPIIPFSSLLAISLGSFRVGLMEILLVSSLITWLLQLSTRHTYSNFSPAPSPSCSPTPLLWPLLLFLGSVWMSWLVTLSLGPSLVETIKWVEVLALYLLVTALLSPRHLKWVIATFLLAGTAQAVLGLYQFFFKVGPEGFLLFGGRFLRAHGTFAQPNPYAGYLGLILPLALSLTVWAGNETLRVSETLRVWVYTKIFALLLIGLSSSLLLAALFASQSRGAWLGFAVAAAVTLIARTKKVVVTSAALVFVGAIVFLTSTFDFSPTQISPTDQTDRVYGAVSQRFAGAMAFVTIPDVSTAEVNDANFATIERLAHWQAAREMWRDNPWLGVGIGNYAVVYPAYAVGRWLDPLGHAHNYLLNIGAETGLVGISGYVIFWIFAFGVTWLAVRHSQGFERAVAAGGLGILVHLHVHNLFDNLYVQGMYLHVSIILALISVIYAKRKKLTHARSHHKLSPNPS